MFHCTNISNAKSLQIHCMRLVCGPPANVLCESKVRHLEVAIMVQQQVLWLQVPAWCITIAIVNCAAAVGSSSGRYTDPPTFTAVFQSLGWGTFTGSLCQSASSKTHHAVLLICQPLRDGGSYQRSTCR